MRPLSIATTKQASTIFPSESLVNIRSGLLSDLKKGKLSPEQAFSRLLEHDPHDPIALVSLGDLRQQAGDLEAAVGYLWRAVEAQPCDWASYIDLSRVEGLRGNTALTIGLAELGLRKMQMDPDGVEAFEMAPVPADDPEVDELVEMSGAQRLESVIESLRDRRDLEPLDVTARLRPARLVHQIQQADDLDKETVDALIREGEAFVPWLTGVLRSSALNSLFEHEFRMAENTMALLGEIGPPEAIAPLLEFYTLEDDDVAGAAGWAVGRIIERQPEGAAAMLHELAPGLDTYTRVAVADILLARPSWPAGAEILERLAENADRLPGPDRGLLLPVIMTALVAIRGRVGLERARALLRRNASLLDRDTRRQCTELLEAADELAQDPDPVPNPGWTVYEICAGEVDWPTGEEDEEDPDSEEGGIRIVAPVRKVPSPGRNDLCPCGSGKKYKKCHLDADAPF